MFRKMRRHAQQLNHEECERLLQTQPRGVLSVLGDNDYPYGIPLNFVHDRDALWFHCAQAGHKLDALEKHNKASFCVLDEGVRNEGEWWLCFKSVIAFGHVHREVDERVIDHVLRLLGKKYFPEDYDLEGDIRRNIGRVTILRFEIDHLSGKAVREK